jgi:hypothetical protein
MAGGLLTWWPAGTTRIDHELAAERLGAEQAATGAPPRVQAHSACRQSEPQLHEQLRLRASTGTTAHSTTTKQQDNKTKTMITKK